MLCNKLDRHLTTFPCQLFPASINRQTFPSQQLAKIHFSGNTSNMILLYFVLNLIKSQIYDVGAGKACTGIID